MGFLITLVGIAAQVITIIVIIDVVLSYFMSPWHPIKQTLDRLIDPMLAPIRRVIPPLGGLDFSPIILLVLVQLIASVLTNFLRQI